MTPEELAKLGVTTGKDAVTNAYARVLVMSPPKAGKTTSLVITAPKPLVLNCDGESAIKGPANLGADFLTINCLNRKELQQGMAAAKALVKAGQVETVILDTITLLGARTERELVANGLEKFDLFRELKKVLVNNVEALCRLPAHVFVVAHFAAQGEFSQGVLPAIPGAAKTEIPAMLDDFIKLDFDPKRTPQRQFWLGPQGDWSASGRNIRKTEAIEADVRVLLGKLGLKGGTNVGQ